MNILEELQTAQQTLGYPTIDKMVAELGSIEAIRSKIEFTETLTQQRTDEIETLRGDLNAAIQATLSGFQLRIEDVFTEDEHIQIQSFCDSLITQVQDTDFISKEKVRTRKASVPIIGFEINGTPVSCTQWKDVLLKTVAYCVRHGSGAIDTILPSITGRTRIYFTQNPTTDNLVTPRKVDGTPWYVETQFGQAMVKTICNKLAVAFNVEPFSIHYKLEDTK